MPDAGEVKAKVTIEYDGGGIEQAKEDLKSLAAAAGSAGESASSLGDTISGVGDRTAESAKGVGDFATSLGALEAPLRSSAEMLPGWSEAIGSSQDAIVGMTASVAELGPPLESTVSLLEEAPRPIAQIAQNAQSLSDGLSTASDGFVQIQESLSQSVPLLPQYAESLKGIGSALGTQSFGLEDFVQNMSVFQSAMEDPAPFSMIQEHLANTGQTWDDFTSSIGSDNTSMLHEMAMNADVSHTVLGGMAADAQNVGATFTESADSAQKFTEQFNGVTGAAIEANKAVAETGATVESVGKAATSGGGGFSGWIEGGGLGGVGGVIGGVLDSLNQIAMPLMAVQMIGMAVQAVGQGIYNAAAIAEGPAAHGFNTFTGSVDMLNQTMQKSSQVFSEAFGQQLIPNIDALNTVMQDNMSSSGGIGGFLGDIVSSASILGGYAIGIPLAITGMFDNPFLQYANQSVSNLFTYPTGGNPTPEQQYITQNQGSIGLNVSQQAGKNIIGGNISLAQAGDPNYLYSQDYASAAQQYYNKQQSSYDISHPISQQELQQTASMQAYAAQQELALAQAPTYGQIAGSYFGAGNIFGGLGVLGSALTGGPAQMYSPGMSTTSAAQSSGLFSGDWGVGAFEEGFSKTLTSAGQGIGGFFSNLLGGGSSGGGGFVGNLLNSMLGGGEAHAATIGTAGGAGGAYDGSFGGGGIGSQIAQQVQNIQLPQMNLSGIASNLGGAFSGIQLPHLDLGGLASNLGGAFSGIQLPHLDLGGIASNLGGAFSGIQLPHLDLGGLASSLGGSFSGIQLPHLDLSGIASSLSGAFSGISLPSIPNIAGQINSQLSGMFSGFTMPSIPNIAGQINATIGGMFSGFSLPSIPDIAGAINGTLSGMFSGFSLPSIPDIAGAINADIGGMFTGFSIPSIPNIAGMINAALSSAFSGISIPSIPLLAGGTENFAGGPAIVGEAGTEVAAYNGHYALFNQGATLVNLPTGASVYPMQDLAGFSFANPQIGQQGIGGTVSPLSLGGGDGTITITINHTTTLDGRVVAQQTIPYITPMMRLAGGIRA